MSILYKLFSTTEDWEKEAVCQGLDPDIFFPFGKEGEARAKSICMTCGVRPNCLAFALRHDVEGIWGGKNAEERRSILRKRKRDSLFN